MNIPDFAVTGLVLITILSFAVLVAVLVILKCSKKDTDKNVAPPTTENSES
jgi:hypothetical protein